MNNMTKILTNLVPQLLPSHTRKIGGGSDPTEINTWSGYVAFNGYSPIQELENTDTIKRYKLEIMETFGDYYVLTREYGSETQMGWVQFPFENFDGSVNSNVGEIFELGKFFTNENELLKWNGDE